MEGGQINELVTPAGQSERRIGNTECAYGYGWGKAGAILNPRCVSEAPLPIGAPDSLRGSRAQSGPPRSGQSQERGFGPICHTPRGSLQHSGSAAHRTPGSGYRPPASSLRGR